MSDIAERLRAQAADIRDWNGKTMTSWDRIRDMVETLKGARCPVDSRTLIGECQQCGCAAGILIRDEQEADDKT